MSHFSDGAADPGRMVRAVAIRHPVQDPLMAADMDERGSGVGMNQS